MVAIASGISTGIAKTLDAVGSMMASKRKDKVGQDVTSGGEARNRIKKTMKANE